MAYIYPSNLCRSAFRVAIAAIVLASSAGCGPSRGGIAYHPTLEDELALFKSSARHMSYVVKTGDTLWSLSRRFGATVGDIIDANGILEVTYLKAGRVLKIPAGGGRAAWTTSGGSARDWVWPVRGDVITAFGQVKGRLKSSGIDIRTRARVKIVAAGNGVVRKAGPFLGLGNTVIIQHDKEGNVITLCGGIGELDVSAGKQVWKGQTIGFSSAVGGGMSIVHFRMFKKGVPVNPRKYLP